MQSNPFSSLLTAGEVPVAPDHWQARGAHGRSDPGLIGGSEKRSQHKRACAVRGRAFTVMTVSCASACGGAAVWGGQQCPGRGHSRLSGRRWLKSPLVPGDCPASMQKSQIRIASYNVLAKCYAKQRHFARCKPGACGSNAASARPCAHTRASPLRCGDVSSPYLSTPPCGGVER